MIGGLQDRLWEWHYRNARHALQREGVKRLIIDVSGIEDPLEKIGRFFVQNSLTRYRFDNPRTDFALLAGISEKDINAYQATFDKGSERERGIMSELKERYNANIRTFTARNIDEAITRCLEPLLDVVGRSP